MIVLGLALCSTRRYYVDRIYALDTTIVPLSISLVLLKN